MKNITECPRCLRPVCGDDELVAYCSNCGFLLGNRCLNNDCPANGLGTYCEDGVIDLDEDACFCPYCGEQSHYYASGCIEERR